MGLLQIKAFLLHGLNGLRLCNLEVAVKHYGGRLFWRNQLGL